MGQQQLLLLVLGMVIVGIAVVAGIQAFSEGKAKADRDAAVSDAMRIISDVQAWKLKPKAFGGGGGADDADFSALGSGGDAFKAIGIPSSRVNDSGQYYTVNGCYTLTGAGDGATLEVFFLDPATNTCSSEQIATVTITGTDPEDISWSYTVSRGESPPAT